jgi:hypothetical protein
MNYLTISLNGNGSTGKVQIFEKAGNQYVVGTGLFGEFHVEVQTFLSNVASESIVFEEAAAGRRFSYGGYAFFNVI